MGFLDDDKEFIDTIIEASLWGRRTYLRRLFATLLVSGQLLRPEMVWNSTFFNYCFWSSKAHARIKGWSSRDVVKEYRLKIRIIQWYKTNNNHNG
jgi:hypothetical protein